MSASMIACFSAAYAWSRKLTFAESGRSVSGIAVVPAPPGSVATSPGPSLSGCERRHPDQHMLYTKNQERGSDRRAGIAARRLVRLRPPAYTRAGPEADDD